MTANKYFDYELRDAHFEVVELLATHYGIEFDVIYCNATGKPLGRLFDEESQMLLEMAKGTPAEMAADLSYRCLMSMKTSIHWILSQVDTSLNERRIAMPREVMAYLINRLFAPVKGEDSHFHTVQLNKIHLFSLLKECEIDENFNSAMAMLLELEAKVGLLSIRPNFTQEDLGTQEATFLASFMAKLRPFHSRQMSQLREREANAKYGTLHRGANTAFMEQMLAEAKKPRPVSDSPLAVKRREHKKVKNKMASLLDEMMFNEKPTNDDVVVEVTIPKPEPKPVNAGGWAKKFLQAKAAV